MPKQHTSFVCQNCGAVSQRWQGRCDSCGAWNTIIEESASSGIGARSAQGTRKGRVFGLASLSDKDEPAAPRITSGLG